MENGVKTVVVLAGGYSSEHEISLASGQTAFAAFEAAGYRTLFVKVERSGYSLDGKDVRIEDLGADYVFNSIHGSPGEDGHISGVLEVLNIPHSTCATFQSALTFNKAQCNAVLRDAGILVPKGELFNEFPGAAAFKHWQFPVFVKPNCAGSSYGVSRVEEPTQLEAAFQYAFTEGRQVLVEEGVTGKEVGCGVLRSSFNFDSKKTESDQSRAIGITEIVPTEGAFFDFEAKYKGKSQEITPARISEGLRTQIETISQTVYDHLNLKGIVRIDYIINESDEPVLIEVNSIPGLSAASIIPQQVASRNWSLATVLSTLAEEHMAAHTEKNS
ncbi:ATP-grasp domain-containing protein [Schleiferiaceae bacterium]|jgi:D-alanine-D-alanine ligase|nr:ATP-grasp domain-containing protein [Schleiferiaceae bacterium]MDA8642134.1 ATP-grasp domain-containing protein [Schleiferiaceae bacterium]MDA8824490.1 ATP-grasp domain-containing protein [Schleiferiaceae bacterium]MDA9192374.1 ATP-grasp domain-containing protein [Schleiferiaceae bacterium]MDB2597096.1 ATP-grasp domain-containing protein [Schleiferiaceae bacterium]